MMRTEAGKALTNLGSVVGCAKNQFRCSVITRADIRHVGLVLDENLGATEVAQFENAGAGVEQKVLGLNVTVANALRVDIRESSEELVCV